MTTHEPYSLLRLKSAEGPLFEALCRVYVESIAPREQKPLSYLRAMVTRPDYRVFLMHNLDAVLGFSIMFVAAQDQFALLEYMAVPRELRNAGLGSRLFGESVRRVWSEVGEIPVLLEVDSPREESDDSELRFRRQDFYRRQGCLRIEELDYCLPLPSEWALPKMDLMVLLPSAWREIRHSDVDAWLGVIYEQVYGSAPDDPRIERMMQTVGDPVRLV